ncbi:MAG: YIP1 family protein [Gammaproteobacteria bacterium]|nr:YIP1 family protein [Gammaproteobacteria bacterium]
MKALIRLGWEALFLSEKPYAEIRESSNPALRGLGFIALVALAVALVGLVGTALEWATTPDMDAIQQTVLQGVQQMDWYQELQDNAEFRKGFRQWYEGEWRVFLQLFGAPNIAIAAVRIILLPLRLALAWLLYGVVAHLFARLLGGQGGLGQMLGCTALAVAPQLLNLATFLPYVAVGGVVGTWTILCRYVALKTCHRLTWGRALAATLLPYVALAVVVSSFACLGGVTTALIFGGGASQ